MKTTDYTIKNQTVSYSVEENGYTIYLGEKVWITQNEPYIPYQELGYEGSCLKQIEELATASEQPTLEEQLSEVQDNQLVMMDAIATSYEKEAELSENQLVLMNAIASLYEAQL